MIATPVMGFDIDARRNSPSFGIGFFASRSIMPRASKCAMRPRRATSVTAPATLFASMWRWTASPMRFSRSVERPTSSGFAAGTVPATSGNPMSATTTITASTRIVLPLLERVRRRFRLCAHRRASKHA